MWDKILMERIDKIIELEGDFLYFKYKGYRCFILRPQYKYRNEPFANIHLCGYVELPKEHKYSQMDYYEIPVEVHCGLSFKRDSEEFYEIIKEFYIGSTEAGNSVIGFDCAHFWDLYNPAISLGNGKYRDMVYVKKELKSLVKQLI
jgi:hypothetical protein